MMPADPTVGETKSAGECKTPLQLFRTVTRHWFWDCYDGMLVLLIGNMVAFSLVAVAAWLFLAAVGIFLEGAPPLGVLFILAVAVALFAPLVLAPVIAGFGYVAGLISSEKEIHFSNYLKGIAVHAFRAWRLAQLTVAALVILAGNAWFYFFSGVLQGSVRLFGYGLGGLCVWLMLGVLLVSVVAVPICIRESLGAWESLRRAALLLLVYTKVVLPVGGLLAVLWGLGIFLRLVGIFLFGFSGTFMLVNALYDVIREYEAHAAEDAELRGVSPRTWKEREELEKRMERREMNAVRYNRTMKDILRPWEG